MMAQTQLDGECNFSKIASDYYDTLPKRDFLVKSDLKTNILWVDTINKELARMVKSNRKCLYIQRDLGENIFYFIAVFYSIVTFYFNVRCFSRLFGIAATE